MSGERPPTIGLTCITIQTDQRPPRLGQNSTYVNAVIRAGAAPLLIPHVADGALLRSVYNVLDGLLLTGGEDIDPVHFGETRHEKCGAICPERDETELALTRWALEEDKPLLAICRGIQVLNVALGGSLYQDIQAQVPGAERHNWYPGFPRDRRSHTLDIAPQTRLGQITGPTPLPVNSLHHQAVKDLAPGLVVVARAPDGIVEAVEAPDHPFAIGVQWHPEELANDDVRAQRLFDALVAASRA